MQTRDTYPPAFVGLGAPLRRFGHVSRTAQTLGIEWAYSVKQGASDLAATMRTLAAAREPAEALAAQAAYLSRAGDRAVARTAVAADLIAALAAELLRPPSAPRPTQAH